MGTDIVTTGQLTTSFVIQITIGLLVNHQDIQDKAYREIKEVIGQKTPTSEDRSKLPYVEALMLESLRYGTIGPVAKPHCTSEDAELNGYFIPKESLVISNIWNISHDSR